MLNNPDSIASRTMGSRKVSKKSTDPGKPNGSGNDQQASGADIADKMNFDNPIPRNINDKEPISMMDAIFAVWKGNDEERDI